MSLTQLVSSPAECAVEMRRRNRLYEELTVTPGAVADYEPLGWTVAKSLISKVKLKKPRSEAENLENRFWCCLYRLGYPELNAGRSFRIAISQGKDTVSKQVDVFAKDDETVIIAECKTAEENKRKSIQKDLAELHANKRGFSEAIRKHYGREFKPKIIWVFIVSQIALTNEDRIRAAEYKISLITPRELGYFEEVAKALGAAARSQFKAEYLAGQSIPALEDKKVAATKIRIGGKPAYVFSAKAGDILSRAFVNHRDLRDAAAAPTYQRLVSANRLTKISHYLQDGGFFPTSILLNFQRRPRFDLLQPSEDREIQFGYLYLPNTFKSLRVIDGQHRLYGCAISELAVEPTLVFVAFEALSPTEEALQFAVINKEQQRVPKKLLDDLEGDLKWESEDLLERINAIASRAVALMNTRFQGPFEDKVSSPGLQDSQEAPLTLPEVKKAIVSAGLIGRFGKQGNLLDGPFQVIRRGDIDNAETLERLTEGLNAYFRMVQESDVERWSAGRSGRVCNNFGVSGHIRLLGEVFRHIETRDGITASELKLSDLLKEVELICAPVFAYLKDSDDAELDRRFNVKLGSGGTKQYYFALSQIINNATPDFQPSGFQEWKSDITKEEQENADRDAKWIQQVVHDLVVKRLQANYGKNFFDLGISSKEIKLKALEKRMSEESFEESGPEKFLDFLDLRRIVEQKDNWPLFQGTFDIKLPDQRGGLAKYVSWFDDINRIRRVAAHPYQRAYTQKDVEILALVKAHLLDVMKHNESKKVA